jgi:hypothetical protein
MKPRRRITFPKAQDYATLRLQKGFATGGMGILRSSNSQKRMSEMGQKRTWQSEFLMSALPSKADISECRLDVRFLPEAEITRSDVPSTSGMIG